MPNSAPINKSSNCLNFSGVLVPLDSRLASLKSAISEDWVELEPYEKAGELVIRVKENPGLFSNRGLKTQCVFSRIPETRGQAFGKLAGAFL